MTDIPPDVERTLAAMTNEQWDTFTAKVRPPDLSEAFREVASQWIGGDRLTALTACGYLSRYLDDDGNMDPAKVEKMVRSLFDDIPRQPTHQDFGQHRPAPPEQAPGHNGIAESVRRFTGYDPRQNASQAVRDQLAKRGYLANGTETRDAANKLYAERTAQQNNTPPSAYN